MWTVVSSWGLITSQIDTAPKLHAGRHGALAGLITSQIDTAPKRPRPLAEVVGGLITSQIDTAPKRNVHLKPPYRV